MQSKNSRAVMLERRRQLRRDQTYAERSLWSQLRRHGHRVKFRRQHSIGDFILDFYCVEARLAIELDGATHDDPAVQQYDRYRQRILESQGITVIRFTDSEVLNDADRTLSRIDAKIRELYEARNGKGDAM